MKLNAPFAGLLLGSLCLSMLAGCGGKSTPGTAAGNSAAGSAAGHAPAPDLTSAPNELVVISPHSKDIEYEFDRIFEAKYPGSKIKWINFGGGHHITRPDYDVDRLLAVIGRFQDRWKKQLYLEPGEAIALGAGVLVASVMDIFHNGMDIAILDTSATAHMPDTLEMPYRAIIVGSGEPGAKPHTYRLGGMTCLAGDVIGDYSFDRPLAVGDKLVFLDMAHYTMVKTTTFTDPQRASLLAVISQNHPDMAFDFAVAHLDMVNGLLEESTRASYIVSLGSRSNDPAMPGKIQAFADKNLPEASRQGVKRSLTSIAVRKAIADRLRPAVTKWVAK